MYESPITFIQKQVNSELNRATDRYVIETLHKFGIDVNKEELIKALAYDRDQYEKGYEDGVKDCNEWRKKLAVLRNFIYDEGLEERLDSYIKLLSDMEDSNENS